VAGLQVVTILVSRGNVQLLGEAYAFGVVWSFAFMGLSMFILRFKFKGPRAMRVPLNPVIAGREFPLGLGLVCFVLISVALTNLLTKPVATVSGIAFTTGFFFVFLGSDWYNKRLRARHSMEHEHKEKFLLERKSELSPEALEVPDGRRRLLVPVRDPNNLAHLRRALEVSHDTGTEIIVATIKVEKGDQAFQHLFTSDEERLFTKVVELAEKYGETIVPIVVPSNNGWFAIANTAKELHVDEILLGRSEQLPPDIQLEQLAVNWALVSEGRSKPINFRIVSPDGEEVSAEL
jgi:hypothetical protein